MLLYLAVMCVVLCCVVLLLLYPVSLRLLGTVLFCTALPSCDVMCIALRCSVVCLCRLCAGALRCSSLLCFAAGDVCCDVLFRCTPLQAYALVSARRRLLAEG